MKEKRSKRHILRLLVLSAIMACAMAVSAFAAETGVITGDVVNVRKGPGTGYDRVEMLARGKQVTILGEENGWYKISWGNSTGYVSAAYVALNGAAQSKEPDATVVGGTTINVRKGPGTNYDRIAMVAAGKRVAILGSESGWYQIGFDGKTGYIMGDYISPDGSAAAAEPQPAVDTSAGNATVTGGTINVRTGPGTSYSCIAQVGSGKRVTLLAAANGWYKMEFDGKTGYISGDYVSPDDGVTAALPAEAPQAAPEPAAPAEAAEGVEPAENAGGEDGTGEETTRSGIITGGTINVRAGAGTEFERVGKVYTGKKVTILGEENGWYKITYGDVTGFVRGDFLYEGDSLPASSVGEQVAAMARQYLGVRYVSGGASPSGFDCSGLTLYLYKQFGYSLPHSASQQYANCGYKVSRSELQPGDLVFFTSSGAGGRITHVAVYAGNGEILHARYSVGQVYSNNLSENYYSKYYVGAVRIA